MNQDEQDRLLREILGGEEISEFRRASLARTLDAVRGRNRRRRAVQTGLLAVVPVLTVIAVLLARLPEPAPLSRNTPGSEPAAQVRQEPVKHITDEELFALFPGRPMALIGPPGHQRLVFLDQKARQSSAKPL